MEDSARDDNLLVAIQPLKQGIHRNSAAQSLDAVRILLVVYRERCGESSLEEIPVVLARARNMSRDRHDVSMQGEGLRGEGMFGWEEDAPTEER
ncbi:MAG: hypothetical protein LZF60_80312 [Nitrospira sp.]|nr:MAG: hypothetical protein LZF60_80312 [Nitrospira sp.]